MDLPTPFDSDAPSGSRRAIIRRNPDDVEEVEMVEAVWGSDPRFSGNTSYRFVRSEGQTFPKNRCLVPASEFQMKVGDKRYRATLQDGNYFYLAAIWEPAMADWPLSFRIITVPANAEVSRYQDRHGVIIQRRQVMQWLNSGVPDDELIVTPAPRILLVEEIKRVQRTLAL